MKDGNYKLIYTSLGSTLCNKHIYVKSFLEHKEQEIL